MPVQRHTSMPDQKNLCTLQNGDKVNLDLNSGYLVTVKPDGRFEPVKEQNCEVFPSEEPFRPGWHEGEDTEAYDRAARGENVEQLFDLEKLTIHEQLKNYTPTTISVRISRAEKEVLHRIADDRNVKLSTVVQDYLAEALEGTDQKFHKAIDPSALRALG